MARRIARLGQAAWTGTVLARQPLSLKIVSQGETARNDKKRLWASFPGDLVTSRDGRSTKIPDKPSHHEHLANALSGISKSAVG
jgi:hypothetical protein